MVVFVRQLVDVGPGPEVISSVFLVRGALAPLEVVLVPYGTSIITALTEVSSISL